MSNDYDKPRGPPAGAKLTERERGALDLYVITPRAVPSVALLTEKYESITAFHEKGSQEEAFEKPIDGGLFCNQHGFECEDDCWVTTVNNDDPKRAGYLVTPCVAYYHELRPLLDLFLFLAGKTFHWCEGESSNAASTPSMTITFAEDGALVRPAPPPADVPAPRYAVPRRGARRAVPTPAPLVRAQNTSKEEEPSTSYGEREDARVAALSAQQREEEARATKVAL